jgi:C1A family cysteine protease
VRLRQRFGWVPDIPDFRDHTVDEFLDTLEPVPPGLASFSLRDKEPVPPWEQGDLSSCSSHATAFCVQYQRQEQGLLNVVPSRLFIYYGTREIEGTTEWNVGTSLRDNIKTIVLQGTPPEEMWPYIPAAYSERPPDRAYAAAEKLQALKYASVGHDLDVIKRLIYNNLPVALGFTVYQSFYWPECQQEGRMPVPNPDEEVVSAHAVVWMGWDDNMPAPNTTDLGTLETRNSWGPFWGDAGHLWMPYEFARNSHMSSDYWVVRLVESIVL